jgi:predicted amidophosphoribosyltransferase
MNEGQAVTHVRVCRDCGEEYRPGVARCADCGGELEDRFEGSEDVTAPEPAREEPAPAPPNYHALFVTPYAADLVPMAERLREAGIEYRLAEAPGRAEEAPSRYGLFVSEENVDAAQKALAEVVASHAGAEAAPGVAAAFDKEQGYLECPACGTKTSAGTAECPECGLVLGAAEGEVEEPGD